MTATLTEAPPTPSARNGTSTAGQGLPGEFRMLPLEEIHESPKNPRTHYDPVALEQLAENFKAVGQITAVVVRPRPKGKGGYELAAGHRRARAAKMAGLLALKAEIRELDDAQFVEILNVENLQRDDLNALEEAQGFVTLIKDAGYDVPKIAARVGRSVKYVYDRIKLLQLIPEAKQLLAAGTITPGHGIILARLSKDDQKRALEADDGFRGGGLLESEDIDESYFAQREPELELGDPKKARSVREFQQWVDRNVRFVPTKVDQGDLAFDLPGTAELLHAATVNKLRVVKITREDRVPDQARDQSERTIGHNGWKRADGDPEPFHDGFPIEDAKPSKTCDYARPGLVVAGPGRGEAFLVCMNEEKCAVHWAEAIKERAKRAKDRERVAARNGGESSSPAPKAGKADPDVLPEDLREQWLAEEIKTRLPEIVKGVKAVIGELKISDEICWNLVADSLDLWGWRKPGKREFSGGSGTEYRYEIEELLLADQVPGKFEHGSLRAVDGPGARSELAWTIWQARDVGNLDEAIDKAVQARWTAHRKAEQKAAAKEATPAQTSAKAKKRAGDVARDKKAKKAKRAKAAAGRAT